MRRLAERVMPGIGRVRAQVEPFAQAWRAANAEALHGAGQLWVALGDSMSQGTGANSIDGGWIGQLHARQVRAGSPLQLVNLSVTGARLGDVLTGQLPALARLGDRVALLDDAVGRGTIAIADVFSQAMPSRQPRR